MKPISLSMRLGLSVSLMGAALVVFLAALAYLALTHELDKMAREAVRGKLEQIRHSLLEGMTAEDIAQQPHSLVDLVVGHDNLHLGVFATGGEPRMLLSVGRTAIERLSPPEGLPEIGQFRSWEDASGHWILTAAREMRLSDGRLVQVVLSIDREPDEELLQAYLKSTLLVLPVLLLLIGGGAWWVVQRGLRPLGRFRKVAALVSTHDLAHRIPGEGLPPELSELAHAINFMLHRLDDGVQQLSQFSDDLAHELRSPITNLMGKAQVTLSRERPPEEYKAVLECCTEELGRVTRIVSDMLFLAQVSHPASLIPFERISLNDEARRVMDMFSISAEEKQIELSLKGEARIHGDRLMVQRAISNLLSNAIRHSPQGGLVTVIISRHHDTASLAIANEGIAIPSQHLPRLFERFYRVDTSRSRAEGGTGLGLAIVRSIMILHQGSVDVSSLSGGMTVFRLHFPLLAGTFDRLSDQAFGHTT